MKSKISQTDNRISFIETHATRGTGFGERESSVKERRVGTHNKTICLCRSGASPQHMLMKIEMISGLRAYMQTDSPAQKLYFYF